MYVWKFSHDEHWCAIGVGAPPLDTQSPLVRTHLSFGLTNGETFLLELVRGESTQVKLEVFDHFTHITWMLCCNRQCFGRGDRYLGDGWWLFSDWRISFSWHLFKGWLAYVVWVIGWWWISSRLTYRWLQHLITWRLFNVSSDHSWQFKSIQEVTTWIHFQKIERNRIMPDQVHCQSHPIFCLVPPQDDYPSNRPHNLCLYLYTSHIHFCTNPETTQSAWVKV